MCVRDSELAGRLREGIEWLDGTEPSGVAPSAALEVFEDATRSILAKNRSPRVGFDYGLNPYRGCQHACAYCEARPRHEWLGFGAGTDFDRKIVVKPRAAELLREAFGAPSWGGDLVVMSGATDPYQPLEASYRLTRACLEVFVKYENPVAIFTKAALIERDIDLLTQLRATVTVSIPFWDATTARTIEPLVPTPQRRMKTVARLAEAGIDVGVAITPILPGISDQDVPAILAAAKDAGARRVTAGLVRLRAPVDAVFEERVGRRLRSEAGYLQAIEALYVATCRRLKLPFSPMGDDFANTPRVESRPRRQLSLFAGSATSSSDP